MESSHLALAHSEHCRVSSLLAAPHKNYLFLDWVPLEKKKYIISIHTAKATMWVHNDRTRCKIHSK